jgi:ParB-like chromosome segregation protein Spo0J
MMNSYKSSVPISDIVPGKNPRKDFGDIGELAATIAATGGQPVNPIVVVPDGSKYRIVDGERRWRALSKLHGKTGMADVLVFLDYGEAQEAVAMLATDDKMQLNETEKARGFQTMLMLGVDDQVIANAARRKVTDVRKARLVAAEAPEQATLDQMICAAEFEGEDRAKVLAADPDKYEARAESIRRHHENEQRKEEFAQCIADLGFDPEKDQPEGYSSIVTCYSPAELKRTVEEHDDEELAVWPCAWNDCYWVLGHKAPERDETPEERERRKTEDRRRAATEALRTALIKEVATSDIMPRMQEAMGRMRDIGYNYQRDNIRRSLMETLTTPEEYRSGQVDYIITSEASMYELVYFLHSPGSTWWWQWVCDLLPAAMEDDFTASEEDLWLLEAARDARSEWERKKVEEADDGQD